MLTEEVTQGSENMYTDVLVFYVGNADGKFKDKQASKEERRKFDNPHTV